MTVSGALFVARDEGSAAPGVESGADFEVDDVGRCCCCCCAPVYAEAMATMDASTTNPGTTAHLLRIVIAPRKRSYQKAPLVKTFTRCASEAGICTWAQLRASR